MSTDRQRSNPRVMRQKVEKAQRLLKEVQEAISLRPGHELWQEALSATNTAEIACDRVISCLQDISVHNKNVEEQKI